MAEIRCICPARPDGEPRHLADTVELHPKLGFRAVDTIKLAIAVLYSEDPDAGLADILGVLREGYVLHGVASWTLANDDGPIPASRPAIREYLLGDPEAAATVADAADDLYAEAVTAPLFRAASMSSPPSQTEPSTSAPTGSSATPPTRLRLSSTSTTPTDDTETTTSSPAGDSSSSPSLASVG